MLRYGALAAVAAFVAMPAHAQPMDAGEARSFVVGKLFTYQCFEGTRGAGRIMQNGSVAGTIQFRGNGATRYAMLPHDTIRVVGDRVCASVRGLPFQPCFNLIKTSHNSFRGSVSGMGFAYCDFVRRDRPMVASVERPRRRPSGAPMELHTGSAKAAFPKPIDSSDLPPTEESAAEDEAADDKPIEAKAEAQAGVEVKGADAKTLASTAPEPKTFELSAAQPKPAEAVGADASAAADVKSELRPTKD